MLNNCNITVFSDTDLIEFPTQKVRPVGIQIVTFTTSVPNLSHIDTIKVTKRTVIKFATFELMTTGCLLFSSLVHCNR